MNERDNDDTARTMGLIEKIIQFDSFLSQSPNLGRNQLWRWTLIQVDYFADKNDVRCVKSARNGWIQSNKLNFPAGIVLSFRIDFAQFRSWWRKYVRWLPNEPMLNVLLSFVMAFARLPSRLNIDYLLIAIKLRQNKLKKNVRHFCRHIESLFCFPFRHWVLLIHWIEVCEIEKS